MLNTTLQKIGGVDYVGVTRAGGVDRVPVCDFNSGNGLKFDGVDDYVNCGNILQYAINQPVTHSIIFKSYSFARQNGGIRRLLANGTSIAGSDVMSIQFAENTGRIRLVYQYDNTNFILYTSNKQLTTNTLYHLVITKNNTLTNTSVNIYINGELTEISFSISGAITVLNYNSLPMILGVYSLLTSGYFSGEMSDIKVFNKELTASEVTQLYNKQNQIVPSSCSANMVANWTFEDKSGVILKDSSPSGYNGTLVNFANTSLGALNAHVDKYGNPITQQ